MAPNEETPLLSNCGTESEKTGFEPAEGQIDSLARGL